MAFNHSTMRPYDAYYRIYIGTTSARTSGPKTRRTQFGAIRFEEQESFDLSA